jgi:hypothetical protein
MRLDILIFDPSIPFPAAVFERLLKKSFKLDIDAGSAQAHYARLFREGHHAADHEKVKDTHGHDHGAGAVL